MNLAAQLYELASSIHGRLIGFGDYSRAIKSMVKRSGASIRVHDSPAWINAWTTHAKTPSTKAWLKAGGLQPNTILVHKSGSPTGAFGNQRLLIGAHEAGHSVVRGATRSASAAMRARLKGKTDAADAMVMRNERRANRAVNSALMETGASAGSIQRWDRLSKQQEKTYRAGFVEQAAYRDRGPGGDLTTPLKMGEVKNTLRKRPWLRSGYQGKP